MSLRDLFGYSIPTVARPRAGAKVSSLGYERRPDDFYPTPPWVTHALLNSVKLRGDVWEPACGDGAISEVLLAHGYLVVSSDIAARGYGMAGRDFLAEDLIHPLGWRRVPLTIFTNPPYGELAKAFIEHALNLMRPVGGQVVMLLNHGFDCSAGVAPLFQDCAAFDAKLTLRGRIRWIEGTKGSPAHHHAWYIWDWGRRPGSPRLGWLA